VQGFSPNEARDQRLPNAFGVCRIAWLDRFRDPCILICLKHAPRRVSAELFRGFGVVDVDALKNAFYGVAALKNRGSEVFSDLCAAGLPQLGIDPRPARFAV